MERRAIWPISLVSIIYSSYQPSPPSNGFIAVHQTAPVIGSDPQPEHNTSSQSIVSDTNPTDINAKPKGAAAPAPPAPAPKPVHAKKKDAAKGSV